MVTPMSLTLGLCFLVLLMLLKGQGMAIAGAYGVISFLYVMLLGAPSVWFASSLFMLAMVALVGQLVLNLQGD